MSKQTATEFTGSVTGLNIQPTATATYSLGTSSLYWSNLYATRHYLNATAYLDGGTAGVTAVTGDITATGYVRGSGNFDQTTSTPGVYMGIPTADTPRILFANGASSNNWQIDNNGSLFRWFTPGVVQMTLSTTTLSSKNHVPLANATYSSGSTTAYWTNLYATTLNLNATASFSGSTAGVISTAAMINIVTATNNNQLRFGNGINSWEINRDNVSTGRLRFYNNNPGSEVMTMLNNGNIGIGVTDPKAKLQINGPLATTITTKTASYQVTATDSFHLGDATSAAIIFTLPTAVGIAGVQYTFKKKDSTANTVTVDAFSTETIDGALTYVLAAQNKYVTLVSDGANWFVVANN